MVSGELFQYVWPVLAVVVYAMVTCMLRLLSTHHGRELDIHNRLRASKEMRRQYLKALEEKLASSTKVMPPSS